MAIILPMLSATSAQGSVFSKEVGIPGLTDSASLTGPTIASGSLLGKNGIAVGKGRLVVLQAWPSSGVLSKLADGEAVKTVPVGFAVTGAGGTFALRYSDPAAAAKYRESDGSVSLEVLSDDDLGTPIAQGLVDVAAAATSVGQQVARSAVFEQNSGLKLTTVPGAAANPSTTQIEKSCVNTKVSTYSPSWTQVGEGYGTSSVTVDFVFKTGASSTVGVGYSASGAAGSFSASGSSSFSSTSATSFPSFSGIAGRQYSTQYQYAKYRYTCIPSGGQAYQYYEARMTSHYGGAMANATQGAPTANYCTTYPGGSSFAKDTTTAYTFSGGVGIGSQIGINLNATTGFSTSAEVTFSFAKGRKLCGSNAGPGGSAKRLVAKE